MTERQYTDRQGNSQVFKTKPFLMQNEDGTIYCEAIQEQAEQLNKLDIQAGDTAFVTLSAVARKYEDSKKQERYSNELTIRTMTMI